MTRVDAGCKGRISRARERSGRPAAVALVAATLALLLRGPVAFAASPLPTGDLSTDTRSAGQGPGLVGDPLLAIGLVIGIAVAAVLLTTAYVRLTGGSRDSREDGR